MNRPPNNKAARNRSDISAGEDPKNDRARHVRTPDELFAFACDWVRKTGWPTYDRDQAIADDIYQKWIAATNAGWATTHSRDKEVMADMIRDAFIDLHDEDGIDSLQIVFMLTFTLRARQEGRLKRQRVH